MSIIQGTSVVAEAGYQIERSLRFNSADSAYLNRTPGSAGNRTTWTFSFWVKRTTLGTLETLFSGYSSGSVIDNIGFTSSDQFTFDIFSGSQIALKHTTQVFRDTSAWYHFVAVWDSGNATAGNRVKLYVNGSQITSFASSTDPSQNANTTINNNVLQAIGQQGDSSEYSNGYMTEVNFVDGQALTASDFGEPNPVTGVWQPKKYTGTYGTNGFYLNFKDNSSTSALGTDYSGNGNTWTTNNFSVTAGAGNDSLVDTPTPYGADTGAGGEVRGNYCTLNPLQLKSTTLSDGNLTSSMTGASGGAFLLGTIALPANSKIYCEATVTSTGDATTLGITSATDTPLNANNAIIGYSYTGNKVIAGASSAYGATYTNNDVIGIAIDTASGTAEFFKNNASQGVITNSNISSQTMFFTCVYFSTSSSAGQNWNFGQRPFAYAAPSGFKALCTTNLPAPIIEDGGEYFNPVLYSGNSSTQNITGVGFAPDMVWIKIRNDAQSHRIFDTVRGASQRIVPNSTAAEANTPTELNAFGSDGFTLGNNPDLNGTGFNYVAWNWKANGTGVTNTAGTITSTVSANTTSGFSIVTYTGTGANATVGHGLGAVPSMIIAKSRSNAFGWYVYHVAANASPATGALILNGTNAFTVDSGAWNNTNPSSTVITLGSGATLNTNLATQVAYCFAAVPGYSAFGSYTGNGSADGPFVYTGFRPAYVLIKRTNTTGVWSLFDNKRIGYNPSNNVIVANADNAEATVSDIDFTSNGFKLRTNADGRNASGSTYIYAAFAENPFKYSLAR